MDFLHLLGSCRYTASARFTTTDKKYRYSYQQLCFPTRWLPCTVFAQLDIPILYRTRIQSVDRLDQWISSNSLVLRLLLLLPGELEKKRAPYTPLLSLQCVCLTQPSQIVVDSSLCSSNIFCGIHTRFTLCRRIGSMWTKLRTKEHNDAT